MIKQGSLLRVKVPSDRSIKPIYLKNILADNPKANIEIVGQSANNEVVLNLLLI
jgi:hypothetical protein